MGIIFQLRLKELREKAGYSQYSFADSLGIAQSTVGNWEAGKREPNFETMQRIADFFNVSTDYLLGRTDEPTQPTAATDTLDDDIRIALFGGGSEITDAQFEEVKQFVRFIKERDRNANK